MADATSGSIHLSLVTRSPTRRLPGSCSLDFQKSASRGRRAERVPRLGAGHHVEHERGVTHGSRDRPVGDEPSARIRVRGVRDASARRLEADDPAAARGDANGAAAVRTFRHRTEARGDGGGRSAARSAGRLAQIPRVPGRREEAEGGGRAIAELGRVGLADEHPARLAQPAGHGGVVRRHEILMEPRAIGRTQSGRVGEILERVGNARQRQRCALAQAAFDVVGHCGCHRLVDRHERAYAGVERVDASKARRRRLARRNAARKNQLA